MRGRLTISDDPARIAAQRLAAVVVRGGHIALAGGSTPRAAYELLAGLALDWSGASLWFGDDRCVPPDDPRSNFLMVKTALLDALGSGGPAVHRIRGELGADAAADDYERVLHEAFSQRPCVFDLALLGLGSDGHTASLFPGDPALQLHGALAAAVARPGLEPLVPRVTLTLPVFNAARQVLFLIRGADKAEAAWRAFAHPPAPDTPASLIDPAPGSLEILADPAAAQKLQALLP